jgi:Family of unknown function (DUF6151)
MLDANRWSVACGIGAITLVAVTLVARTIKRQSSPEIVCALRCECGTIQGEIRAKKEDGLRLLCYCKDCQEYAKFVAHEGNKAQPALGRGGYSSLVQVCKVAVTIHTGQDKLQLARQTAPALPNGTAPYSMHRYYAKCCHVPVMNTVKSLGFVGVLTDRLEASACEKFAPPVRFAIESATDTPLDIPDMTSFRFLWNLIRFAPWSGAGPFDYQQTPQYWGKKDA